MERIGRSVEQELAQKGSRDAPSLGAVMAAWVEAVGESVSRNAWPMRVGRDGTLHVATASATWAFELDRLAPEIVEKLAARLGGEAPKKLRFAVGPLPEPAVPEEDPPTSRPSPEVDQEAAAAAADAASGIDDPELRELALRAARASLSRRPSDRSF
jgi:hypothetical protein